MLRGLVYTKLEPLLNRIAKSLSQRNITPNQLTLAGAFLNLLAGLAYSGGLFVLGGILVLIGALGDLLDGPVARLTGETSPFGAFLDSTVDRYSDFFLFGGVTLHLAMIESWGGAVAGLGIILGTFLTSYTKARSESLIPACSAGFLERPERIIILLVGSFITPLFPWCLAVLLVGTHVTALQRIVFVRKALIK